MTATSTTDGFALREAPPYSAALPHNIMLGENQ